ncbi:hypothetical protein NOF55_15255 [Rhizobiaceae bacterium BDR2-2]|uniref:Uncharacterized protein n=1 Tax=Ectorhizobium quercum TaxID=2965071 RepID=A0AAE3N1I3_9HYPH|nr:hypothetical protein [Ectorhizobium quercum]MCX8998471.1 hypothetical protein [Ectorhizobium quercum]
MSRLFQRVLFGLVLPPLIVSLLFGFAGGLIDNLPLFGDALAPGADTTEILTIIAEEMADTLLRSTLFFTAVAAPAVAVVGPLAFVLTRRPAILTVIGAAAGATWAAWFDYLDSFFTGPGIEWDWPLAGGLYGLLAAALAVRFFGRRKLL